MLHSGFGYLTGKKNKMGFRNSLICLVLLFCGRLLVEAQDFDYCQKARECLAEGDCVKAQKMYNVYLEIGNDPNYGLEREIKECSELSKQFKIGEMIEIDGHHYPIAYIDITGQHGWAIAEVEVLHSFVSTKTIDGIKFRPYLNGVIILNKELLPAYYDFVDDEEFEYIYKNKSMISGFLNGIYCSNVYKKTIEYSAWDGIATVSYLFTFQDFKTGYKETKTKNSDFRAHTFVKIVF